MAEEEIAAQANSTTMRPLPPSRVSDELRAQIDVLARLHSRSTTVEIRVALEHWVEHSRTDAETQRLALAARAEIEREAQAKSDALAALLGAPAPSGGRARKPGDAAGQ